MIFLLEICVAMMLRPTFFSSQMSANFALHVLLVAYGLRNQTSRHERSVYGLFRCNPVNLWRAKWHPPRLPVLVSKSFHELILALSMKVWRELDALLPVYHFLDWH